MTDATSDRGVLSPAFTGAVFGLLVVIAIATTALWFMERSTRVDTERRLMEVGGKAFAYEAAMKMPNGQVTPVAEGEIKTRTVSLDGRQCRALAISEEVAKRLGFPAGDVILVEGAAAAASTSGPAGPR